MKGGWELFGEMTNLRIWVVDMERRKVTKELTWKDMLNDKLHM